MQPFSIYLQLGFEHISNLAGFDHILFLVALTAVYRIEQWRSILILVTAFTIGHSVTLALTSLGTLTVPSDIIEFLICPNPGEGFKPMAKIASGGELSRIMLAIKNGLMATDPVGTYVFDEVDTTGWPTTTGPRAEARDSWWLTVVSIRLSCSLTKSAFGSLSSNAFRTTASGVFRLCARSSKAVL